MRNKFLRCRSGGTHLHVRGPEGEVVPQQLHDEGAILVRLLAEGVELGNALVKGLQKERK